MRSVRNPDTLAHVITELGGTVVQADSFQFDLPLSEVKTVVPKLCEFGVGVRKVSERVGDHPTKLFSVRSLLRGWSFITEAMMLIKGEALIHYFKLPFSIHGERGGLWKVTVSGPGQLHTEGETHEPSPYDLLDRMLSGGSERFAETFQTRRRRSRRCQDQRSGCRRVSQSQRRQNANSIGGWPDESQRL